MTTKNLKSTFRNAAQYTMAGAYACMGLPPQDGFDATGAVFDRIQYGMNILRLKLGK